MKTITKFAVMLFLTLTVVHVNAQISKGGIPKSFQTPELPDTTSAVLMPIVNIDSLQTADSEEENMELPFRFGFAIDVDLGINNHGQWDTLQNGDKIWRLSIKSKDAFSLNLIFDDFWLPIGTEFYVYNGSKDMILGAFTPEISNNDLYKFSTDLIKGDEIILEYYEPSYADNGRINVDKVIHGYKNTFPESGHDQTIQNCYFDITCPDGNDWCVERRSVSMILVDDNTRWCSGCLINNERQDLTPYYLTANHCLQGDENTWIFRFKYWSPTCNQGDDATHWVSINGSTTRANWAQTDFALLELNSQPPSGFGVLYAGWDRTSTPPNSSTVIHHPRGSTMKISTANDPAISSSWGSGPANTHWQITLNRGTTEGGSSGAPLFNQNRRIVGQNHGGFAGCPPVQKQYGRFDVSWNGGGTAQTRLRDWLDPDNTGVTTVGPTSPTIYLINRTLTGTHRFAALEEIHIEGNVSTGGIFCPPNNVPFTAEPGSDVEIKARRVVVKPGTHFKAGSKVRITAVEEVECADNIVEGDYVDVFCNAQISMKTGGSYYASTNPRPDEEKTESELNISENITLYPNPSTGKFEIAFLDSEAKFSEVIIYDMSGRIVYERHQLNENKLPIDICHLNKGPYVVQVLSSGNSYTKKIIVH